MIRILLLRLLLTCTMSASLAFAVFSPALAAPGDPPTASRVTVTLTSDRQHNGAAAWYDADGRLRTQAEVPLTQRDSSSGRWSSSLVFVRPSPDTPVVALFQSAGRFARCEIWIDDQRVAEHTAHGELATSSCRAGETNTHGDRRVGG
ncbi:hypothetical protein [Gordonia sp. 'Campus']|uniref:hypothetical protein n=1 Tax=Gordonia sp. 'Campus' TaxID=2915824 RepID=UPI001EE4E508|nr:hypothetical protein [Gordonia sp. 'Campus']